MKQILLSGLLGAVILFVWSFLAWTIIPIHTPTLRTIQNEDSVIAVMKKSMPEKGVYNFPAMPAVTPEMSKEEKDAVMKKMEDKALRGPVGMIVYDPQGAGFMTPAETATGFVLFFITAALAAWFLQRSTAAAGPYLVRVVFCGMLGIFLSVAVYLSEWNWMGYPADYTVGLIMDAVIGWLLAGLGIAAIIKAKKETTQQILISKP